MQPPDREFTFVVGGKRVRGSDLTKDDELRIFGHVSGDSPGTPLQHEVTMPKGTKVHKMYDAMTGKGMSKGKAARIAQSKTGRSLMTGKKPKRK